VAQVQKATGYPYRRAYAITMEAHTTGRAVVWTGDIDECLRVEGVLREIGLRTDIVA
jgi:ATP-dependent Clp protease adapter protein ClpS